MKKRWFFVLFTVLLSSVLLVGCGGMMRESRYNKQMEQFKQDGDKNMDFFVMHFGQQPFHVIHEDNEQKDAGIWKLYREEGTILRNTSRGPLTGRRITTDTYVSSSHGCTILLIFDRRKNGVMTDYKVGNCE